MVRADEVTAEGQGEVTRRPAPAGKKVAEVVVAVGGCAGGAGRRAMMKVGQDGIKDGSI